MQRIELRDAVTNRALYVLEIKHKTTVINDNSGTGKTALINLIDAPTDAGLQIISDSTIIVVRNENDLHGATAALSKCLLIIDESLDDSILAGLLDLYEKKDGNRQRYDWSIILVCRDVTRLQDIGLHSNAVLRPDNQNTIRLVYEEDSSLYTHIKPTDVSCVYCEDSTSGADFYRMLLPERIPVNDIMLNTGGYNTLYNKIQDTALSDNTLIVADGTTYDNIYINLSAYIRSCKRSACVYAPGSFEELYLLIDVFDDVPEIVQFRKDKNLPSDYSGTTENYAIWLINRVKHQKNLSYQKSKDHLDWQLFTAENLHRVSQDFPSILKHYVDIFKPHMNKCIERSLYNAVTRDHRFDAFKGKGCTERVAEIIHSNPTIIEPNSVFSRLSQSYTIDAFLRDPPTLIEVMYRHEDYTKWFTTNFPNGASSKDEVLSRLHSEK